MADPIQLRDQAGTIPGSGRSSARAQVPPEACVESIARGILPDRPRERLGAPIDLGGLHVGIKERAAERRVLVDQAKPVQEPVTRTVRMTGRNEPRLGGVDHGAEVLLGPCERIAAGWKEPKRIVDAEPPGHEPAEYLARCARAGRSFKTQLASLRCRGGRVRRRGCAPIVVLRGDEDRMSLQGKLP